MLFFGHVAASFLIADATDTDRAAAVVGSLTPDIIDKTTHLFGLTPSRWLAHGLPFFALAVVATKPALSPKQWRAFVMGYTGHLICDLWNGSHVPWFAPFEPQSRATRERWPKSIGRWAIYLLPEVVGSFITWRRLSRNVASRDPVQD